MLDSDNKKRVADALDNSDMNPRNQMYFDLAAYALRAICSSVEERSDVPSLVDGLKTMEFVRAIRRSAKTRRFEPVEQVAF